MAKELGGPISSTGGHVLSSGWGGVVVGWGGVVGWISRSDARPFR